MRAHPEPRVRAVEVGLADARVPRAAARMAARVRTGDGWRWTLHYARGNTLVGKDGSVGEVVESVVLRAWRGPLWAVAFWITAPIVVCPVCVATLAPTESGVLRVHGPTGDRCPAGGTDGVRAAVVEAAPGEVKFGFGSAYVRVSNGTTHWTRVGSPELARWLFESGGTGNDGQEAT